MAGQDNTWCEVRECLKQGEHDGHKGAFAVVPYGATEYPRCSGKGGCVSFHPHFKTSREATDYAKAQNTRAADRYTPTKLWSPPEPSNVH